MYRFNDPNIERLSYSVSGFRTLGTAATPQNIFTIENPSASTNFVIVRYIDLCSNTTAALATVAPTIKLCSTTALPTGGTTLTAQKGFTNFSTASAICRAGTASDGGGATAITATASTVFYAAFSKRLHTAAGYLDSAPMILLGDSMLYRELAVLKPGEAILVQGVTASAATTHYIVNCDWEEMPINSVT